MDAERYAKDRLENLYRVLASSLTPETMHTVIQEIIDDVNKPHSPDALALAARLAEQLAVLR